MKTIGDLVRILGGGKTLAERAAHVRLEPELMRLGPGEILFERGEEGDALYVVQRGTLSVLDGGGEQATVLAQLHDGAVLGEMSLFTGGRRTATARADVECELIRVSRTMLEGLFEADPGFEQKLIEVSLRRLKRNQLLGILRQIAGEIDHETIEKLESVLEWIHLAPQERLFEQGDPGDGLYFLISGLLKVEAFRRDGGLERVGYVTAGEVVGEMGLITGEQRSADVWAVRNCDLARLSQRAFDTFGAEHPLIYVEIAKTIIKRLRGNPQIVTGRSQNTIVVPLSEDIPVDVIARGLSDALAYDRTPLRIDQKLVESELSAQEPWSSGSETPQGFRLEAWLDERELHYSDLVVEADLRSGAWNQLCRDYGDKIVFAARADQPPPPTVAETIAFWRHGAECRLLFIHAETDREWGHARPWIEATGIQSLFHLRLGNAQDAGRIARCLSGSAIGLALGGGGAKGIFHIGAVRALRQAGIPIDCVSGTSIGAIIAAFVAMEMGTGEILRLCHQLFVKTNPFKRITFPILSILHPTPTELLSEAAFADRRIEDLPIPFACVSTNISSSTEMIHTSGPMKQVVLASASLPGIIQPVPLNGEILVDGGVVDNLPISVLPNDCGTVIASDLHVDRTIRTDYEKFPSPLRLLLSRLFRRRSGKHFPTILEVISGVMKTTTGRSATDDLRRADILIRAPVDDVGFLDFGNLREIEQRGYDHTQMVLNGLSDTELKRRLLLDRSPSGAPRAPQESTASRP